MAIVYLKCTLFRPDPLQAALQSAEVDRMGDSLTSLDREAAGENMGLPVIQGRQMDHYER